MLTNNVIDKIKGVIYGQAIGDALGLGTESMTAKQVKNTYPEGLRKYSDIIDDSYRKRWKKGEWTDDTDQMICIINSIINRKELHENHVAEEFYQWMNRGPKDIGYFTSKVLKMPEYTKNPHTAAKNRWEEEGKITAPNGALMRTSVVGTWMFWDKSKVTDFAERIAKTTHYDPRCVASCVLVSQIIRNLIYENRIMTIDELKHLGCCYHPKVEKYIDKGMSSSIHALELDDVNKRAYTLRGLSVALWAMNNDMSFEEGLFKVVSEGGDSDTNAALTCSILGAKLGFSAIPDYWIKNLQNRDKLDKLIDDYILVLKSSYDATC
ncbi:MAG: ADP-ribosylglycohydrolase family protein [Bacteroidales bacterium]